MKYIKYFLVVIFLSLVLFFAHYTLPSKDIVTIVGTEVVRTEVGNTPLFWVRGGTGETLNRDIRFINGIKFGTDSERVYRNEDTGWRWPPYLKFDSGDIQAQAQRLAGNNAERVLINHYGIRSRTFSIYPNVTSIRELNPGETKPLNWLRYIGFGALVVLLLVFWRLWRLFSLWIVDRYQGLKFRIFGK